MTEEESGSETSSSSVIRPGEDHSDRRMWWTLTLIGVVVFVGVILLGRPLVEARLNAARNLDRATAMILGTNSELDAVDRAVRSSSPGDSLPATRPARHWRISSPGRSPPSCVVGI